MFCKLVNEYINLKDTGWDLRESSVLKGAICGFLLTEQRRSGVQKNKFGWHPQLRGNCAR